MDELVDLAGKALAAKRRMDALGMRDVQGWSLEDQVRADIEYRIAQQEWWAAESAYKHAIDAYVTNPTT